MLQKLMDVFPKEITELQPHREVEILIKSVSRETPTSKAPYRMTTLKLVELTLQLKEMLENGYIRPSVSPWGTPVLFMRKKYGTHRLCIE